MAQIRRLPSAPGQTEIWVVMRDDGSCRQAFNNYQTAQRCYNHLQSMDDRENQRNGIDWAAVEAAEEEERERARKEREAKEKLELWKVNEMPIMERRLINNPSLYKDNPEYYNVAKYTKRVDVLEILYRSNNERIVGEVGANKSAPENLAKRARSRAADMKWKKEQIEEYGKVGYAATLGFGCFVRSIVIAVIVGILYLIISSIG